MDVRLIVVQGKPQGREIPIHVSPFIIGRSPECHLRPNSDMVSRFHCKLTIQGEEVSIRDLGSSNGTIVDGERLTDVFTLNDGDIFQVGPLAFQVAIKHTTAARAAKEPPTAAPTGVSQPTASADDVAEWLISDSHSDVPMSGSDVYGGKTVLATNPLKDSTPPAPEATNNERKESAQEMTGAAPGGTSKAADSKKKSQEATGAAAHAAQEAIRKLLERRPHK